jgi:hypothetical protein
MSVLSRRTFRRGWALLGFTRMRALSPPIAMTRQDKV